MGSSFRMEPVGVVRLEGEKAHIEIHPPYIDALLGLEDFSHLMVFWWFHRNDTPEKRATLRVHPRKDPANPLRGVFSTHAPVRPNLVALSFCRNLSIVKSRIFIDGIDAFDGTPVIDIKPYIPVEDLAPGGVSVPDWV